MRYLISLLLLAAALPALGAAPLSGPEPTTGVINQMSSTMTVSSVLISTVAPVSVVVSTVAAYRFVTVQNTCTDADLYCGENSTAISTQTPIGFLVARSTNNYTFTLKPGQDFFCMSTARSSPCRAATIRGR